MRKIMLAAVLVAIVVLAVTIASIASANPQNGPTRVVGTRGDDVLAGGHGPDVLIGKGGDDRLWGGKGPDVFRCGPGYDVAHNRKGTGADTFVGCEEVDEG